MTEVEQKEAACLSEKEQPENLFQQIFGLLIFEYADAPVFTPDALRRIFR